MPIFKIARYRYDETGRRLGGLCKEEVDGEVLCDGIFGIRDGTSHLTHIPTGRLVGYFLNAEAARECASELAEVDLPWRAKTKKAWLTGDSVTRGEAKRIAEERGGWREV